MQGMEKTVLKKTGNQYVSGINSLVLDANETAPSFRGAGFTQFPAEMTKTDERFITEEHPEFSEQLKNRELQIEPTMVRGWKNQLGEIHEIDYNVRKKEEHFVIEDWGSELLAYNGLSKDMQE